MYLISTIIAKTIFFISNLLNIGSGYTWPGHAVLKIYPNILKDVSCKLTAKTIFVTGTNGKTTTSKLIAHILRSQGYRVLHNDTGANLQNGFISTVLLNSTLWGKLNYDFAVIELDEFTLPKVLESISPDILLLLNISRDQLDRHWELDIIYDKWKQALEEMKERPILVLDSEQPEFSELSDSYLGKFYFFNKDKSMISKTKLIGSFNAKNVNSAVLTCEHLGLKKEDIIKSLKTFEFAYGRGEQIAYKNKNFRVFLAKNPESLNQNLSMLNEYKLDYDTLLYVLNDNVPDGHDVSWIFDVHAGLLNISSRKRNIYVSGTRAYDMSIRLKYAGINVLEENVSESLEHIIRKVSANSHCNDIVVLPNYSAMLEFRKIVLGKSIL
ncbi:MurT ligase domain-containing protein [Patescibacteria group bacterium]